MINLRDCRIFIYLRSNSTMHCGSLSLLHQRSYLQNAKKLIISKFGNKNLIKTKTMSALLGLDFQSSHIKYIYEQCDEWIQWGQERIKWYILFPMCSQHVLIMFPWGSPSSQIIS
jgi:hypothetical protein